MEARKKELDQLEKDKKVLSDKVKKLQVKISEAEKSSDNSLENMKKEMQALEKEDKKLKDKEEEYLQAEKV